MKFLTNKKLQIKKMSKAYKNKYKIKLKIKKLNKSINTNGQNIYKPTFNPIQ